MNENRESTRTIFFDMRYFKISMFKQSQELTVFKLTALKVLKKKKYFLELR